MARDPQQLRKTYESKLGKDLVAKLTDQQINIISKFYNSLGKEEQSEIDSKIFKGYNDSELHEMAKSFVEENSEDTKKYEPADKFIDDTQERLDGELRGTSDGILSEIDKLIAEYQGKVDSVKKSSTKLKENVKEKSSALAFIVGNVPQKEEELVDEDIDSRILELLGIEDTTGLDYSDYRSLLKEKMAADRMNDNEGDSGDAELISDEYKRIKGSTGKFKVNSKKINVQSFVAKTKPSSSVVSVTPLLPSVTPQETEQPIQPERQGMDETLALIASKLNSVDKNVQQTTRNLQDKDAAENAQKNQDRLTAENTAAQRKEDRIERTAVLGGIYAGVQKTVKPLTDMMGGLFDFFQRLGFAMFIMELLKFLQDPQKYINGVIEWINKQIIKLENSIENFVISTLVKPLNKAINGLNDQFSKFIGMINPLLEKLKGIGIDTQIPELKIPEISESSIRDNFSIPSIPLLGETSPSPSESGTTQSESKPQETLMGKPRSQFTSPLVAKGGVEQGESAKSQVSQAGFGESEFLLYRDTVAQIESKGEYDIQGGAKDEFGVGQFAGRYQMGAAAREDAARLLGETYQGDSEAARKTFREDKQMQERYFAAYTRANHGYLMKKSPEYRELSKEEKLQALGYAHNAGWSEAAKWLKRGRTASVEDEFGTKSDKFPKNIKEVQEQVVRQPISAPPPTTTTEPRKADPNRSAFDPAIDTAGNEVPIGTVVGGEEYRPRPTKVEPVSGPQSQNIPQPPVKAALTTIESLTGDNTSGTALAAAGASQNQVNSFSPINFADLSRISTLITLGVGRA
jgi:Skp family chaperone for outer membrane proteins